MSRIHGLASTYCHGGCRCVPCTQANTSMVLDQVAKRTARLAADPTLAPHGIYTTYRNWGCRCEPCTRDHRARCAAYDAARRVAP